MTKKVVSEGAISTTTTRQDRGRSNVAELLSIGIFFEGLDHRSNLIHHAGTQKKNRCFTQKTHCDVKEGRKLMVHTKSSCTFNEYHDQAIDQCTLNEAKMSTLFGN